MGANAEACEARNEDGKTCYVPADIRDIPCVNIYKAYFLAYKGDLLKNKTVDIERKIVYNVIAKLMNFYLKGLI